jgi:hypothetical protein
MGRDRFIHAHCRIDSGVVRWPVAGIDLVSADDTIKAAAIVMLLVIMIPRHLSRRCPRVRLAVPSTRGPAWHGSRVADLFMPSVGVGQDLRAKDDASAAIDQSCDPVDQYLGVSAAAMSVATSGCPRDVARGK